MKHVVYKVCWGCVFSANLSAVLLSFASPWGAGDEISGSFYLVALVVLWFSAMAANTVVTDIAAEYLCILFGAVKSQKLDITRKARIAPLEVPGRTEPYVVVYCLKSKATSDIDDTLLNLEKSWLSNQDYPNTVYLVLSGTSNKELYTAEMEAINAWNAHHSEKGVVCKYLRRQRSILYKYGQYLDLIMLINGHDGAGEDGVALYKDALPEDGSGNFDDSTDVDSFKGHLEYDRLVILDKDNVLGADFFVKANVVYNKSDLDIDIIQPAIVPPDLETRAGDGSDTFYGSFTMASHTMGSRMAGFREKFFPTATFFGKGIIRRTKYNELLLGYNSETHTTEESTRLPRYEIWYRSRRHLNKKQALKKSRLRKTKLLIRT